VEGQSPSFDRTAFRRQIAELIGGCEEGPPDGGFSLAAPPCQQAPEPEPFDSEQAPAPEPPFGAVSTPPAGRAPAGGNGSKGAFLPREPQSLAQTGLTEALVESLVLKYVVHATTATGRDVANQVRLPFGIVGEVLRRLKDDRLVVYKGAATVGDFLYEPTEAGVDRARLLGKQCTYFGAAPVPLEQYARSVAAQSIRRHRPTMAALRKAFADLVLGEELFLQLGQAINSGLGIFLYGAPGNGKTSIAERITRAFGESIWIPRSLAVGSEIIRLFDPSNHEALPEAPQAGPGAGDHVDRRWVQIRRPTIVAGGELTMDLLDVTYNPGMGLGEAPLQLKSNGGMLVIDDFGRQRITPAELLNRWIVPLEKRYDFLNLRTGRKVQVPVDQLIVFSTNLEPRDLVDEAFLRRIPYKIDITDPTEAELRGLFADTAAEMGIAHCPESVDYLIEKHYRERGRAMRFCHARDLLHQVRVYCEFLDRPPAVTRQSLDAAVKNYFAIMDGGGIPAGLPPR